MFRVWKNVHKAAVEASKWVDFAGDGKQIGISYPDNNYGCIVIDQDHDVFVSSVEDGVVLENLTVQKRKAAFNEYATMEMMPFSHMVRAQSAHSRSDFILVCLLGAGLPEINALVRRIVRARSWYNVTGVAPISIRAQVMIVI